MGEEEMEWMRRRMSLIDAEHAAWSEDHTAAAYNFLRGNNSAECATLFALLDSDGRLNFSTDIPLKWNKVLVFVRDTSKNVDAENINQTVQCEVLKGSLGDCMLRLMQSLYLPIMLDEGNGQTAVSKDFVGELDRFMASLTESLFHAKGQTILYVPPVKLASDGGIQLKDKELTQRLESIVIRWTRQIKEVVRGHDRAREVEVSGPLAEVEFWSQRSLDLGRIVEQIKHSGVTTILTILEHLKSPYLESFMSLSKKIDVEAIVAAENLKFLSVLEKPCKDLSTVELASMPFVLPVLLQRIRMIWRISPYYNTVEKITGLLCMVSNEIINRCASGIPLADMFEGDIGKCKLALEQGIQACESWKTLYNAMTEMQMKSNGQKDMSVESINRSESIELGSRSIFAPVEAFLQRCQDMLEVCDSQSQFSRNIKLPIFGGTRGWEVTKALWEMQDSFQKIVATLKSLPYNLLDIKITRWHDDFNQFKDGVKDLEVMMQNIMLMAFRHSSSLSESIELMEAFKLISRRHSICLCVEQMESEVCAAFTRELGIIKKQFDQLRRRPFMDYSFPRFAGTALCAMQFQCRIEGPMMLLMKATPYLLQTVEGLELGSQYNQIVTLIEQFVRSQHSEWMNNLDPSLVKKLDRSLLDESGDGFYVVKFDPSYLGLYYEMRYWRRLGWEIPELAYSLLERHDELQTLKSNILITIRDCNKILEAMDSEERGLVADRILCLTTSISPGLEKLTWLSDEKELERFSQEVHFKCHVLGETVKMLRNAKRKISLICDSISNSWLVSIDKKRIYDVGEFRTKQAEHRAAVQIQFKTAYGNIKDTIAVSYLKCASESNEVRSKWDEFKKKVEGRMELSLRNAVAKSLQELSNTLNADAKTASPMFNTIAVLDKSSSSVRLTPSNQELLDIVQVVTRELITVVSAVPRLRTGAAFNSTFQQHLSLAHSNPSGQTSLRSFYEVIAMDQEEALMMITAGVVGISDSIHQYLQYWEKKYKSVWEQDKDAYIRRYERAKKPLSAFESDISKYRDLQDDIQAEETVTGIRFLRIDCGPLKHAIIAHCEGWVNKFITLLNHIAKTELEDIYLYMERNTEDFKRTPDNLDMLTEAVNHWRAVMDERATIEARFEPIREKYKTLSKYEVVVAEEEKTMLDNMATKWEAFQTMLRNVERDLEESKKGFFITLSGMVKSFTKEVADARNSFLERMPTTSAITTANALNFIEEESAKVEVFQQKAQSLWAGMGIFGMEKLSIKENATTMKDLELLKSLWNLKEEWEEAFDSWKDGLFSELDTASMESSASVFSKRVFKMGRDTKGWGVWNDLKDTIDAFKSTLPLTLDLRNPAMRPRHWQTLMEQVGQVFDPYSREFTLAKVAELRLDLHAASISELSISASKELAIEEAIGKIKETWQDLDIDVVPYREVPKVYKLQSTEEIFAVLEEHRVTLSSMKSNRAHLHFAKDIDQWEHNLSQVSDSLEIIIQVQRQWVYLESIFVGSEDIRKQLPAETSLFDSVNETFINSMSSLKDKQNAIQALCVPGLINMFNDMGITLEKIQKSLEDYLEQKRQQFPRFYFLSSDNLLEILGQAKDPRNVQPHLKKCFEGIKRLELHLPGEEGRRNYETTGIFSPDGEYLPFESPVILNTPPEEWLNRVEAAMYSAVKLHLMKAIEDSKLSKKDKWVKDNLGQCVISAGQIKWTSDCEKILSGTESTKVSLRKLMKKWISYLNKLTDMTRSRISKIDRNKVTALITIEVHARDVIEKLMKAGCSTPTDFEWASQLRFYWEKDDCVIKQVLSVFSYGYEYQGNNGRLVITPLTDRCYITLGAALFTRRGGNPLGPAGTGKTETVKDLGKALARYVIVFNCSDGVDYKMTAKMFSGIAQTGAWICLDEFNRIEVEVLSVVATQIASLMSAIKAGLTCFVFDGSEIRLIPTCGIFVTMNPGYAGRSELPENLKAMLRPVSMMVPDFTLISENMLFSEGFRNAKILAKKLIAIMELSQRQLSKQDHYDYGLRSFVIPIARAAGATKRADPDMDENLILMGAIRDLIMPKLIYADISLFNGLLSDLFPGVELPPKESDVLRKAVEQELSVQGLQVVKDFVTKIMQLYDCMLARHGNMLVGRTGSGKTEAWKALQRAQSRLKDEGCEGFERVLVHIINPLALSNDEIYGAFNRLTNEWTDGVLSNIMRKICSDESSDKKWTLFDGPVDTLWIESMNSLLDDNKILTLLNGERISMPSQISLLFEVEDLSQASPATVSRAGMIYLNVEDLGWWPYANSWIQCKVATGTDQVKVKTLQALLEKYVDKALAFRKHNCKELVPTDDLSSVTTLCTLFDSLATSENGVSPVEGESYVPMIENWFLFGLIWSIGASLDEESRTKFNIFIREMDPRYPAAFTVYDYYIDAKKKGYAPWEEKLSGSYRVPMGSPFHKIQVPTIDTVRISYVLKALALVNKHAMIVGKVGVGKTLIVQSVLRSLPEGLSTMTINFSAQTSSNSLQDTIEGRFEKRTKGIFAPPGGKRLVCFLDDVNMPKKTQFGFMPPLELLKLWIDNGYWYDRQKQELKYLKNMQLVSAMAPPGGGRNSISQRVQACFSLVNITTPNDNQMKRIFGAILTAKLSNFEDDIRMLGDHLVSACVDVYNAICVELLPTPSKSHYVFNMRDLAKVIQGLLQATKENYVSKDMMLQLFCHECFRVYADRMWDVNDKQWTQELLDQKLKDLFNTDWKSLFRDGELPVFTSCLNQGGDSIYEPISDWKDLKDVLEENLQELLAQPGIFSMNLVLFKDAIEHLCHIHRVLLQPRGNLLLVGVGGSGRKSLTKLAAFVADMKVFTVNVSKSYSSSQFHDDLKVLYQQAGLGENKPPTVFLFDDTQIVVETFLEDINNMLSTGEVPNLFTKDDLLTVFDQCRAAAKKANAGETDDELYSYFIEKARENLHIVLCLSPVQESFHKRLQMFPGLVNCTTIDWFLDWPEDALHEVAVKLMADEQNMRSNDIKAKVCKLFVTIHKSVIDMSTKMLMQLKRHNYVTPTSYLDFAKGYRKLLAEKKHQLEDNATKLKGGLQTLNDTKEQVAKMQVVCQEKKEVVAKAKHECEEILIEIVQEKRVIDEQEKQVNEEAAKIEKEAKVCNAIAYDCQQDLDKALPALQSAEEALNVLTKKDLSEVKAYAKPPALVELTMGAVMTVLKKPPTWDEAKKQLGDSSFLANLLKYDKEQLVDALLKKIGKFTADPDFTPDAVGKVSGAARGLCLWVRAMETYGYVNKDVAPKKAKLKLAQDTLQKKEAALQDARNKLDEVRKKVQALKDKYDKSLASKEALQNELDDLEMKLERAEKLVSGLAGEKTRWEISITTFQEEIRKLPGDCLVAAAFLSYAGPFSSEYRDELVKGVWVPEVFKSEVPSSLNFGLSSFLANAGDVLDWNLQGLPADSFSTENGVLVTRSNRWLLMIDPQEQAKKWVKNMEAKNGLVIVDQQMDNMMRKVEDCIQLGTPVLLMDVLEEIDPSLEPVLAKSFIYRGSQVYLKLGDKEIDYNTNFKLYITTKLPNPHYSPEISVKTTIINFAVKEQSLQAQLLTLVVQKERPDLDKQRNELIVQVTAGKKTQAECEDQILRLLATAEGPLLDNLDLILTLDKSKETFETVKKSLEVAEVTTKSIEAASAAYKPCAERASLLYFLLNELEAIDPMYQFSLEAYIQLFFISIAKSTKAENIAERIKNLIDYHTYAVYKYTSRGLFEKHKLLLSLQICSKILLAANMITNEEWQFFLRGGSVLDRSKQPQNPAPSWISENSWDDITELATALPAQFETLVTSLQQETAKWEIWFKNSEPEIIELPGDWEEKCNDLQHMILLRCFRQDRLIFATNTYVANVLGQKFVEPPILDLEESLGDSSPTTTLLFILSAGVDPTSSLLQFAASKGLANNFHAVALGQGQGPVAIRLIKEAVKTGGWVFLANCHLMTSWLSQLEKIIQELEKTKPHEMFRLWLSSEPSNKFPISILQRSLKMTAEPPKGLRANVLRLYNQMTEESFQKCKSQSKYQKLLFSLAYFHSVLLERRKFGTLGLNIPYDFNDTDFQVSDDLLKTYLDAYEKTPFEALKFLISEANYGGRVTDEIDRRVLASYLNQFYCEDTISIPNYALSTVAMYHVPDDGSLQTHKEFIQTWPTVDRPEAFGQHPNADIASQLAASRLMMTTISSLQPRTTGSKAGASQEEIVLNIATDLLQQVPEVLDLAEIQGLKSGDPSALHTVLFQEIERYNILLKQIKESCSNLQKGIQGLVVMSGELETMYNDFFEARVPRKWIKSYPSMKPLGSWTRDLMQRLRELRAWAEGTYPLVYWLGGFTYPADFLTAVLQTTARRNLIPIDTLTWEFTVLNNKDEADITEPPKEGIYIKGLYLEGAGWDHQNDCLQEPQAMELIVPMPIIHFKPTINKKKTFKGYYMCPLYLYPIRTGTRERPSFLLYVTVKSGSVSPEHWVKRGTALLLSLAT